MTDLYLQTTPPSVEKLGFEARLSTNADTWPQEVMAELYRQCPFVGTYEVAPVMTEVNGDSGHGLGYFQISNSSATSALGPGGASLRKIRGVRTIKVPIVIRDNKLSPLDVFMDSSGRAFPFNETRLRAALFRPELVDSLGDPPRVVSLIDSLYPPSDRQRLSHGVDISKTSQARGNLFDAIAPTITKGALDRIRTELEKDANLLRYLVSNDATRPMLEKMSRLEPITSEDVAKVASRSIGPDVIQVERVGDFYRIKMANSGDFAPEAAEVDRPTAVDMAGEDLVQEADQYGAGTISTDPVVHNSLEDERVAKIERFGQYRVKTTDGREIMGWAFPVVLDFKGTALPMTLFTNGSESGIQETIVGSQSGDSPNIIRAEPKNYGFFYRVTAEGTAIAFVPVHIQSSYADPEGQGFLIQTLLGQQLKTVFVPGLKEIMPMSDGVVGLPDDVRWAPLTEQVTPLADTAQSFLKLSALRHHDSTVEVISDKTTWSFRGAPLQKVAQAWRQGLNPADALFMACCLGMSPGLAAETLVKAGTYRSCSVPGCRHIGAQGTKLAQARAEAKAIWDKVPHAPILIKEAAVIEDATTVDKVLSLGFLNPENVSIFVQFLPEFDTVISKLAALLVATRIGLDEVPEDSIKSAMERLEEVIAGLKKLVYTQS